MFRVSGLWTIFHLEARSVQQIKQDSAQDPEVLCVHQLLAMLGEASSGLFPVV